MGDLRMCSLGINVSPEKISPPSNGGRLIFLLRHQESFELRHFIVCKNFYILEMEIGKLCDMLGSFELKYKSIYLLLDIRIKLVTEHLKMFIPLLPLFLHIPLCAHPTSFLLILNV